jgi:hypothetical protein
MLEMSHLKSHSGTVDRIGPLPPTSEIDFLFLILFRNSVDLLSLFIFLLIQANAQDQKRAGISVRSLSLLPSSVS